MLNYKSVINRCLGFLLTYPLQLTWTSFHISGFLSLLSSYLYVHQRDRPIRTSHILLRLVLRYAPYRVLGVLDVESGGFYDFKNCFNFLASSG